jgi:WD40 repeat protein
MASNRAVLALLALCSILASPLAGQAPAELVIQDSHAEGIDSFALSPDGAYLATVGGGEVKFWRADDGVLLRTIALEGSPLEVRMMKQSGQALIGPFGPEGEMGVFRMSDGSMLRKMPFLRGCALSPDGKLAAGSACVSYGKYEIQVRNLDTGALLRAIDLGGARESSFDLSPDGSHLLTFADGAVTIYETRTWKQGLRLPTEAMGIFVQRALFNADSRSFSLLGLSEEGGMADIAVCDAATGRLIGSSPFAEGERFFLDPSSRPLPAQAKGGGLAFRHPDGAPDLDGAALAALAKASQAERRGKRLALLMPDKSLAAYELPSMRERYRLASHSSKVLACALAPSGKALVSLSADRRLRLWNLGTGQLEATRDQAGNLIALSDDGSRILTGDAKGELSIWDSKTLAKLGSALAADTELTSLAFARGTASRVLYGYGENAGRALLDLASGKVLARSEPQRTGYVDRVAELARSPAGDLVAAASSGRLQILKAADLSFLRELAIPSATAAAFSPDGALIAAGTPGNEVRLWELESGRLLRSLDSGRGGGGITKLAFSPDGARLFGACDDGSVSEWGIPAGELAAKRSTHGARIRDLRLSGDGSFLVSASEDGKAKVLDLKSGSSLCLLAFDEGDWYAYDERGRFDCSDGGRDHVRFVRGLEVLEPDQLWEAYHQTGLVASFLGRTGPAIPAALPKLAAPPTVRILSPAEGAETSAETLELSVQAQPGSNGLGKLFVIVNGKVADEGTRGIAVKGSGASRSFTIALKEGENSIRAAAWDKDGAIYGQSPALRVVRRAAVAEKPDMYILAIGVSAYRDQNIPQLGAPDDDAKVVASTLHGLATGLYGNVYERVLTDKEATGRAVMKAFNEILARARPIDTVILFMAGHGITEEGVYYFLPSDAAIDDIPGSGLSMDDLGDFVKGLASQKVAIFLDTCQSGAALKSIGLAIMSRGLEVRKALVDLAKRKGAIVFAAASATQAANEIAELGHGFFTYCLLAALGDRRGLGVEGVVSVTKLVGAVEGATREVARRYETLQTPVKWVQGEDFGLGLAE